MITLNIEGMRCEGCVARIHKALTEAGMEHEVSLERKQVVLLSDDADVNKAIEEIEDLGFLATRA